MVRILRLDQLKPGDLILETGDRRIAAATRGRFGHASVALGRLVKIEAEGIATGVVLNPFDLEAWQRDEARIVGVPIGSDDVLVLRRGDLDIGTIDGEALWEAGRHYSVKKLVDLPDLDARTKRLLEKKIGSQAGEQPDNPEGRFCSEVAARILRLKDVMVSPSALADAAGLEPVPQAILELDDDWVPESTNTANAALASLVPKIRVGLARLAVDEADAAAAAVQCGATSRKKAAADLKELLEPELRNAIRLLEAIRKLEPTILHTSRSPVSPSTRRDAI